MSRNHETVLLGNRKPDTLQSGDTVDSRLSPGSDIEESGTAGVKLLTALKVPAGIITGN